MIGRLDHKRSRKKKQIVQLFQVFWGLTLIDGIKEVASAGETIWEKTAVYKLMQSVSREHDETFEQRKGRQQFQ